MIAETAIVYLEFGKSPLFELEPFVKSLPAEKTMMLPNPPLPLVILLSIPFSTGVVTL